MPVFVAGQPVGKTNHGRTLYSRATRHVDARLCGPGANAYYTVCRWKRHAELESIDWSDNASWFDIKMYADDQVKSSPSFDPCPVLTYSFLIVSMDFYTLAGEKPDQRARTQTILQFHEEIS